MRFCSISSGSSGNCIYIGSDDTHILIDAGISGVKVETGLNLLGLTGADIDAILVTHEHSDHISGLGVLSRKYGTPIFCTQGTSSNLTAKSVGDISNSTLTEVCPGQEFLIGDLTIHPTSISHDASQSCAYTVRCGRKSAGVLTDLGCYDDEIVDDFCGQDVLLIEANHDVRMLRAGKYPYYLQNRILSDSGHLSNELCGRLLDRLLKENTKQVFLGHLSKENNYPALALQSVICEIDSGDGSLSSSDFPMEVAPRDIASKCISF